MNARSFDPAAGLRYAPASDFAFAAAAHAADPYVGLNLTTPGEATFRINNRLVPNDNHPRSVKL